MIYSDVNVISDVGTFLNYSYKFSKKFNLYVTAGIGRAKTQSQFPLFARTSFLHRMIHLVPHEKTRTQINWLGLKKRFSFFDGKFDLDISASLNRRLFKNGKDYLFEPEFQVSIASWIEYRYDIEVIYDEYMKDFNYGPNYKRVESSHFEFSKLDLEVSGNWRITDNVLFNFGIAYSPRHIFFYDADYETRQYSNGELDPSLYVNYQGLVGNPDWNGNGSRTDFIYLTSGLTYKFMKKKNS